MVWINSTCLSKNFRVRARPSPTQQLNEEEVKTPKVNGKKRDGWVEREKEGKTMKRYTLSREIQIIVLLFN